MAGSGARVGTGASCSGGAISAALEMGADGAEILPPAKRLGCNGATVGMGGSAGSGSMVGQGVAVGKIVVGSRVAVGALVKVGSGPGEGSIATPSPLFSRCAIKFQPPMKPLKLKAVSKSLAEALNLAGRLLALLLAARLVVIVIVLMIIVVIIVVVIVVVFSTPSLVAGCGLAGCG